MSKIKEVLNEIYENPNLRKNCIPTFISSPGIGKTQEINEFAVEKNVKLLTEITSTKMPHEFSGCAVPDYETGMMKYFDYDALLSLNDGDILFLDEVFSANPIVLSAFLVVLDKRILPSGKKLKDILIVAASNEENISSISNAIKERFIFYPIKFNKNEWIKYMEKYLIPGFIIDEIANLIEKENFNNNYNFYTPRSVEKNIQILYSGGISPYNKLESLLKMTISNKTNTEIEINDNFKIVENETISFLKVIKEHHKNKPIF